MPNLQSVRSKIPAKRVLLALGGVTAVALGVVQTTDTMAASTDASTAKVSQIATENFFPTPLPSSISCSESGSLGFHKANVSWPSAGPGMSYRVTLWKDGMSGIERAPAYQTGTTWVLAVNYDLAWGNYVLTVQTVNVASGTTDASRLVSSGYRKITVGSNAQRNGSCQGGAGVQANATWEDQSSFTPAAPAVDGASEFSRSRKLNSPAAASPSASSTDSPSASTTPENASPTSSTTAETEPSTPASSEPSADDETGSPSSTSDPVAEAKPAEVTIGVEAAAGKSTLILFHDGVEKCRAPLAEDDTPSVNSATNTVSITNGTTVKKVDTETCAVS
ncbi:hypothetical protein ACK8HH_16275 [Gordonia sp. LUNF6]|uniref:hypothetical protein n=1 Tax=Gordonia sp. LUNF6 TaxID=3388658 RepID=UPI00399C10D8